MPGFPIDGHILYMCGRRTYVILYFDPRVFLFRSVFDPVPNFTKQNPWFSDHYPHHLRN